VKNLVKLFYPLFFLVSIILPRNKNIWIFGNVDGYLDNTRYFFEFASMQNKYVCIWLANNKEELKSIKQIGLNTVLKNSIKGYWHSARAYMTFICTGFSDVNRVLSLKSKVINFWHGTPIKKVYLDSQHDLSRFGTTKLAIFISTMLMKYLISRISFYYASNKLEQELVCSSAKMNITKSLAIGTPRLDQIKLMASNKIKDTIDSNKKIILYAPTWREGGSWSNKFNLSNVDYSDLNNFLYKENALLLVKPHPLTLQKEIESWGLISSENIKFVSEFNINDINVLYTISDMLITDISSSMFDYLIFKKPIILFMPDKDDYINGSRGIYDYFIDTLNLYSIGNWNDLIKKLMDKTLKIPLLNKIANDFQNIQSVNLAIYEDIINRFGRV